MSNFSKFFLRIYELRNSSIKNRKDFLTGFFNAAGKDGPIYLSDDTLKSICNGIRNLSEELMNHFPNPSLTNKEKEYLMDALNKNRILDFFDAFDIDSEEKQNYELLCKAIAMQFENFMKYGDIAGESNSVKELYKYLLDLDLPKGIDNNEDAVYSAKAMFFNALKEFAKVDKSKPLVDSRAQLDNVFQNFFNSFKAFEKRCDHKGLAFYQDVRNELIYNNERLSKYIKMASEPGSLPLPIQKGASIIVYDHVDYHDIKASVMLDEDAVFGFNNTIKAIEGTGIPKNREYVFFTEQYAFYLDNDKKNLLPGLFDAITALNEAEIVLNKVTDYIIRFCSFIGNSMPNFFIALLLMNLFAIQLGWLPVMSSGTSFISGIMPTLTLGISMAAKYTRQVRATVLEELDKDYVTGLKAKGVRGGVILWGSVLKASMLTIVTLLALSIGSLLGGTAIVETIFMWDGVGKLAVDSITMRDYPLIQAYVVWMAIIYVVVNLVTDIIYHYLDPRVRLGGLKD